MPNHTRKKFEYIARDMQTSVFPQFILVRLWSKNYQKYVGMVAPIGMVNREKVQEYFMAPADWHRFQDHCQQLAVRQPGFVEKTKLNALASLRRLNVFTYQRIWKQDLGAMANAQLAKLYSRFVVLDEPCYAYGNIVFNFEFGERAYFSGAIKEILKRRAPKKAAEYFHALSVPAKPTIFYRQTLDILKLSYAVSKQPKLSRVFRATAAPAVQEIISKQYPRMYRELRRQQRAYHWLFHNWEGPVMDIADFIMFVQDILRRGNVRAEYETKKAEPAVLARTQQRIMKDLHFSPQERRFAAIAQFAYWFQPFRKAHQFKSCWHMHKLFREIAGRLHMSVDQVRYMTHEEVAQALKTGAPDLKEINGRRQLFICRYQRGAWWIVSGNAAEKFIRDNIQMPPCRNRSKLTGTPACNGTARGAARTVNSLADAQDFKRGEILVSYATNPTLLPAMRQAAAIITEEGGLTCHAAIVSRELNVPCIVGVPRAVTILKTGCRVAVDATRGIMKKL
ncbi:MAG: PEP-utilizing enzyme [Patescibacteria group bacterium]|nr:PEP-utilizing enzyme [Patescibacteria group bacterium]MDD5715478.1 PEP-utilizing enzyme [Patescibacteria group bacterium]